MHYAGRNWLCLLALGGLFGVTSAAEPPAPAPSQYPLLRGPVLPPLTLDAPANPIDWGRAQEPAPPRTHHLSGNVGIYYVKPCWSGGSFVPKASDGPAYDFGVAPRFSLGYYPGQGAGARARSWNYDESGVGPRPLGGKFGR